MEVCKGGHHHLQNSPIFPFLLFIIIIIISLSGSLQGWADVHGINPSADFSSDPGNEFQLCALCSQDLIQHLPLDQPTSNLVTNTILSLFLKNKFYKSIHVLFYLAGYTRKLTRHDISKLPLIRLRTNEAEGVFASPSPTACLICSH